MSFLVPLEECCGGDRVQKEKRQHVAGRMRAPKQILQPRSMGTQEKSEENPPILVSWRRRRDELKEVEVSEAEDEDAMCVAENIPFGDCLYTKTTPRCHGRGSGPVDRTSEALGLHPILEHSNTTYEEVNQDSEKARYPFGALPRVLFPSNNLTNKTQQACFRPPS